ncbi:MAG: SCO1664 family protein [Nocardioides sp.]
MTAPGTETLDGIADGELLLHGRVMPASNATFVGEIHGVRVVYKPVRGERPLWDFPDGTLAAREAAAYVVSQALGWNVVPPTMRRDGPHGFGMVQVWCEPDPDDEAVAIVPGGGTPDGWRHVFDGLDERDQVVSLVHESSDALRRMTIFDVVVNNADRKGGHVLAMSDGHRYGVDHGVTFHSEPKLRTVLWGWAGEDVPDEELAVLEALAHDLRADLGDRLLDLLTPHEVSATLGRTTRLLRTGTLPHPQGGWPAIPWPPF